MGQVESKEDPVLKDLFGRVERYTYIAVGGLLVVAVVIALAGAVALLWHGALDWTNTAPVFEVVDRLLFILMLVEIMHTVSASIRRVLVITLETSEAMRGHAWSDTVSEQFHASMIELGVLGGLILVMVSSIFLLHRIPPESKQA